MAAPFCLDVPLDYHSVNFLTTRFHKIMRWSYNENYSKIQHLYAS